MINVKNATTIPAESAMASRSPNNPNNPDHRSDKILARSKVPAESSIEEECVAGMNDGKDVEVADTNAPSAKGPREGGRAANFWLDPAAAKALANGFLIAKRGAGENASQWVMIATSWTTRTSNTTNGNGIIRLQ